MMIEINDFEEVMQIKMSRLMDGRPLYWVAAYLVDGLLIDTGCGYTAEELADALAGRGLDLAVNTHHHEDHVAGNQLIMQKYGINIYAHPGAVPLISRPPNLNPYQELVWGCPHPSRVKPVTGQIKTKRFTFEVLETPGHCDDHIVLLEPRKGWCFSGDLFVSESQKVLRADENIGGIARSLEKLLGVKTDRLILFTSIGRVVEEGREALRQYMDFLRRLSEEVCLLHRGGFSENDIRDRIFGRESSLAAFTDGHYSTVNLIRSVLSSFSTGINTDHEIS
jgi:glyoxylase-like metal-dependent hydrolase (beta-lactamase superfamily II)